MEVLQVSPNALSELFDKDPLTLTDADITTIINYYRTERNRIAQLEASGKRPSKPKKETAAKPAKGAKTPKVTLTPEQRAAILDL